jgi:phytoene/squalene synthetase
MAVDHSENFPVTCLRLPSRLRRPVTLIYRFARDTNNFADEGNSEPATRRQQPDYFRQQLTRSEAGRPPEIPWFSALVKAADAGAARLASHARACSRMTSYEHWQQKAADGRARLQAIGGSRVARTIRP